jgi:hypothetical protein
LRVEHGSWIFVVECVDDVELGLLETLLFCHDFDHVFGFAYDSVVFFA